MAFWRALIGVCLLAVAGASQAADSFTFKIATLAPDGSSWMRTMRAAADDIAVRTEQRVQFKFYPGGVMGNDKSVLRKIRVGQLQGTALTGGGLADIYPDSTIYGLPLLFRNYAEVDYVRELMDPVFNKGLEDAGFVNFGYAEGGFAYFMSGKPVRGVAGLRDEKAWVPEGDRVSYAVLEALGVSPVVLPLTDVPAGLQTGLITAVAASPLGAVAFQWHTSVKYVTDVPLAYLLGVFVIEKRAFEKVGAADQRVVREVLGATFGRLNMQNRRDNEQARQALIEQGLEFVQPQGGEVARLRERADATTDKLAAQGLFSAVLAARVKGLLAEFRNRQAAVRD